MKGRRHALLVGVEEYVHFPDTPFCHADVDLLERTLTETCDYDAAAVKSLKLAPNDVITVDDLVHQVELVASSAERGDTVLFYFAGHGHLENGTAYLVLPRTDPGDWGNTGIALAHVCSILRREGLVCFRILDACHSGQDVRSGARQVNASQFVRSTVIGSAGSGWLTLASCAESEVSFSDASIGQGVFTHFLAEAIQQVSPGAPVYPERLKLDVCDKVARWAAERSKQQSPTCNMAISGNASVATRRSRPVAAVPSPSTADEDLASRLARVRTLLDERPSDDKQTPTTWMVELRDRLRERFDALDWFGSEQVDELEVVNADWMPREVKDILVPQIRSANMMPRHTYETEAIRRENTFANIFPVSLRALGFADREPAFLRHSIHQQGDFDSYVGLGMDSDEITPSARVFVYLVPLQLNHALIVGALLRPAGTSNWTDIANETLILSLSNTAHKSRAMAMIDDCISKLHTRYQRETAKMVEYLEWEQRQSGSDK